MPQQSIFDFIVSQGLGWFLAIVLLVPGAMVLVLLALLAISKRYLGLDFQALSRQRDLEIKAEHDLTSEIKSLREKLADMADAMWGTRDYTDRQMKAIQQHFDAQNDEILGKLDKLIDQHHKIVIYLIKMNKKTEAIRNTDVFLKERK